MLSETHSQREARGARETGGARGMLLIVSSPSGGGKGTLIQRVLKTVPNVGYSVSFTTRAPRQGEKAGRDYHFVSTETFQQMVQEDGFLEWAIVHGNLYGTGREQVLHELSLGRDIILEIDVQGAESVRRLAPEAVGVFILPPSFEILRQRLTRRGSERKPDLDLRLRNASGEVLRYSEFDYVVINDELERAAAQLASIVYAERARRERQEEEVRRVLASFPPAGQES
ncbi:MAG: guanylate kinase [Blastocatellia bacterium]|jgi:guanylate kinase|nr:guanylate kinase [Blastocatellia bacterium]